MNLTEYYQKELEADLLLLDRKRKIIMPASILLRGMIGFIFLFMWAAFTAVLLRLKPDRSDDSFSILIFIMIGFAVVVAGSITLVSVFGTKELIKIYPKGLAAQSKKVLLGFGIFFLIAAIVLLGANIISSRVKSLDDLNVVKIIGLLFVFGVGGGILLYNLFKIENKFKIEFKKRIITKIVEFTFPGSSYDPEKAISEFYFYESKLFSRHPYMKYKGSDFMSIIKDGVEMDLSYLDISTQPPSTSSRTGSSNNNSRTVFDGIFFKMISKKDNQGETRVYFHNRAIIAVEKIGSAISSVFGGSNSKLVKTGDVDFDKTFLVYTNNSDGWFLYLNDKKMKCIMDLYERTKIKFSLSFVNNKVFLALMQPRNVLDPTIFSSLVSLEKIQKYCNALEDIYAYHILAQ
jgi:hypothetical protein